MLCGHHRDRTLGHVDAQPHQFLVNGREMLRHEVRRFMADVEMHIIKTIAFDLIVNRARHYVTRSQLHPLLVIVCHKTVTSFGMEQPSTLAAHRLCDEEVFDLQIIQAGRVELHHLHIGNARAGSPCHRNPITRGAARGGAELVDAARAACRHNRGLGGVGRHLPRCGVERIGTPHPARARVFRLMPPGDEIDAGAIGHQRDIGAFFGGFEQRSLHRPAGRVIDMDDAAMRMAAFAREVQIASLIHGITVERHAQLAQAINRARRAFDNKFHRLAVVQPSACDHRIADMILKRVARIKNRRDPALCPCGRATAQRALGEHEHLALLRQRQRSGEPSRARADDKDVVLDGIRQKELRSS